MIRIFFNILKNLDPEVAHKLTINALKLPNPFIESNNDFSILSNDINGLSFKNPIGMAAGFDKNAEVINSLFNLDLVSPSVELSHQDLNLEMLNLGYSD